MKRCCKQLFFTIILIATFYYIRLDNKLLIHPFCPFHRIMGFPCPGCGGVRAARALLSMDIMGALYINPVSVVFCVLVPILFILSWIDFIFKKHTIPTFMTIVSRPKPTFFIILFFVINWIWSICKEL